jgi:hypothetical protein
VGFDARSRSHRSTDGKALAWRQNGDAKSVIVGVAPDVLSGSDGNVFAMQ